MVIKMESKRGIFNGLERKLEEELDFDFSVSEIKIDDEESFLSLIKEPFDSEYYNKDRRIFTVVKGSQIFQDLLCPPCSEIRINCFTAMSRTEI